MPCHAVECGLWTPLSLSHSLTLPHSRHNCVRNQARRACNGLCVCGGVLPV